MTLQFFPTNQAWVFCYHDSIVTLHDERTMFKFRSDAVEAANRRGLAVGFQKYGAQVSAHVESFK